MFGNIAMVLRSNMRRISSRWTWWHKKAFPVFWFGFLGLFSVASLPGVIQQQVPASTLLIPLGMAAFGYVLMRWLVFPLVDEVWIQEEELIVRNGGQEDRFPISNIINVEASQFTNPDRITLLLKVPSRFGREIAFSPPRRWWPFGRHPIAQELLRRAHRLDGLESDERSDPGGSASIDGRNCAVSGHCQMDELPLTSSQIDNDIFALFRAGRRLRGMAWMILVLAWPPASFLVVGTVIAMALGQPVAVRALVVFPCLALPVFGTVIGYFRLARHVASGHRWAIVMSLVVAMGSINLGLFIFWLGGVAPMMLATEIIAVVASVLVARPLIQALRAANRLAPLLAEASCDE